MNGFSSADMSTAAANGFRDGLAAQPGAAQEPIGYRWRNSVSESWQYSNFPCGWEHQPLYAATVAAAPVEMSPEFTDTARAAIAWVLLHHQGGSSPIGQPLRFALGMGDHDPLPEWRIAEAKRYAEWAGATTAKFHEARASTPAAPGIDLEQFREAVVFWRDCAVREFRYGTASEADALLALIDASPKGEEACDEAFGEFADDYLTDGNGYAPTSTYEACGKAFRSAWPDQNAATEAAKAELKRLHGDDRTVGARRAEALNRVDRDDNGDGADASPTVGSTDENIDLLPELRDVEDYFTSVDPNPIHLATVRQAISFVTGLKATSAEVGS